MSKAEDLQKHNKKVISFFGLQEATVKELFPCALKGAAVNGSGKLYLAPNFICFIGKGFKKISRYWAISDLLDLKTEGKSLKIMAVDGKSSIFTSFVDGSEGCERCLRAMKRVLYGMNGNSILHAAVDDLDFPKVKQILELDASRLHDVNRCAQTPLIIACVKGDLSMVATLLDFYKKSKTDINILTKGYHVLHSITAIAGIDDKILTAVLEYPGINVTAQVTHDKTTPLHYYCANSGSVDCMAIGALFFKHGANANAVTLQNETPLHKAIFNKKVRVLMVQMMLKNNADPNIKAGVDGDTPLFYAIRLKRKDLVECLLGEGGANVDITNNQGYNAQQIALQEYERSDESEKPVCAEILELIQSVQQLNVFLASLDLQEFSRKFISEGFHEMSLLCQLDEARMKELGITKIGARLKLMKEIENLKVKFAQSEKERKEQRMQQLLQKGGHQIDVASIRESLNLEAGKWEIEPNEIEFTAKLGSGASGQVFKGLYKGIQVAIKVLNASNFDNELDEFRKEFEILRKVNDPHMIHFYGAVIDKNLCMVMELCENGSLHDLLKRKDFKLTWDLAIKFALDMAEGIAILHNHDPPIIHRDLKSLNLLVTKKWDVKLCDFGLSRLVQGDMKTFTRLCGTYAYIAPEMFKGSPASAKSDVFSMGIVLWELINSAVKGSYEQPYEEFHFSMDVQIIVQVADGLRPTIPVGSPMDFVEIFQACTAAVDRPTVVEVVDKIKIMREDFLKDPEAWAKLKPYVKPGGPSAAVQVDKPTTARNFKGWGDKKKVESDPQDKQIPANAQESLPSVVRRHSGSIENPVTSNSVKKLRDTARPRRSSEVVAMKPRSEKTPPSSPPPIKERTTSLPRRGDKDDKGITIPKKTIMNPDLPESPLDKLGLDLDEIKKKSQPQAPERRVSSRKGSSPAECTSTKADRKKNSEADQRLLSESKPFANTS